MALTPLGDPIEPTVVPSTLSARPYRVRWTRLVSDRSTWEARWRDIGDYLRPGWLRLYPEAEVNKGLKKRKSIVNERPGRALRILASGMLAGFSSPARNWIRLIIGDAGLNQSRAVKSYLRELRNRVLRTLARTNFYTIIARYYYDLGSFGTAVMWMGADLNNIAHFRLLPIGTYCLQNDSDGRPMILFAQRTFTAEQAGQRFGLDADFTTVLKANITENPDAYHQFVHVVEPNPDYIEGSINPAHMLWRDVWFELQSEQDTKILEQGGYFEKPFTAQRWDAIDENVYGESPGYEALGSIKELQLITRRKAQILDKLVNPPMKGPTSLMGNRISTLPGDTTFTDSSSANDRFEPAFQVDVNALREAREDIAGLVVQIDGLFYADLFLAMSSNAIPNMTAREVEERHEEKMLQLGPVLEGLHDETVEPLVIRMLGLLERADELPPIPPELEGVEYEIEEISILAQAQKLVATIGVERYIQFGMALSDKNPEVLDKIDFDQTMDHYSDLVGVAPEITRSDDQVEDIRQQRAQQLQAEQAAQQASAAKDGTAAVKNLSDAQVAGGVDLDRMLDAIGGSAVQPPAQA